MARAFPLCPFKRVATGAEVPFHHRCRSRQIFGVGRILPDFPKNLPEKFFVQLLPTHILHKDQENLFLV